MMNAVVTLTSDCSSDTLGRAVPGVLRVVEQGDAELTSTLAGDYAVSVIFEQEDKDARFAAELGRRAWRRRVENE